MTARLMKNTSALAAQMVLVLTVLTGGIAAAIWLPADRVAAGASGSEARTLVAQAATRITTIGSYGVSFTFEIDVQGGQKVKITGTGLADTERNVHSGRFNVPGFGSVELRQLGEIGYLALPGGRVDASGHHWLGIPGQNGDAALGGQDPLAMLRALDGAAEVENKGNEKVAGVTTVRYSISPDPERMFAAAQAKGALTTPVPAGTAASVTHAKVDLWLDDQQLPRRFRMNLGTDQVSMRMEFEFADYGGSVDVLPPPQSDVTQVTDMQQAVLVLQSALRR